jgi:hypothetical protein
MNAHHRQRRHLLSIFDRRARAERRAAAEQQLEHQAAVRRILEQATRQLPVIDPVQLQRAPLLTPGQVHRNQAAER